MSVSTPVVIPQGTWAIDTAHSDVEFKVTDLHQLFATIKGRFTEFEGTIEAGETLADTRARGVIKVASVTTDQPQRDKHLRSPDFFEADTYPEFRFESRSIERVGEDTLRVTGTLNLKGQDQDVELETRVLGTGQDPQGQERIVFDAGGELGWGPMTVQLVLNVSAVKAAEGQQR